MLRRENYCRQKSLSRRQECFLFCTKLRYGNHGETWIVKNDNLIWPGQSTFLKFPHSTKIIFLRTSVGLIHVLRFFTTSLEVKITSTSKNFEYFPCEFFTYTVLSLPPIAITQILFIVKLVIPKRKVTNNSKPSLQLHTFSQVSLFSPFQVLLFPIHLYLLLLIHTPIS